MGPSAETPQQGRPGGPDFGPELPRGGLHAQEAPGGLAHPGLRVLWLCPLL